MIEFGIAAKNLPLKRRATERLPIFIGAALALILTRRRILLFAVIPGIVTVIESRYWSETAGGQLPDSLLDPMWIGHVVVILMRDILGIFFACARTATVFDLLRGRRFAFGPGFATARRNLRSLALIAAFLATIEILSLLLFNGDNRLIPSGFQAASVGFILQWGPFLVMYFSIPIIADVVQVPGSLAGQAVGFGQIEPARQRRGQLPQPPAMTAGVLVAGFHTERQRPDHLLAVFGVAVASIESRGGACGFRV